MPEVEEADRQIEEVSSGLLSILESFLCGVTTISLGASDTDDSLDAMRQMRDLRLASTKAGRKWIDLYERHHLEVAALAAADDAFRDLALELIRNAGPLLRGDEPVPRGVARNAARFVARLRKAKLSRQLRAELSWLTPLIGRLSGRRSSEIVRELTEREPGKSPRRPRSAAEKAR
jgi:hypothetical protein